MQYRSLLSTAFVTVLVVFGASTAFGQSEGCSNAEDFRTWRVVILSNYQSTKPNEKQIAIDAAKKFIEKADRCKIKDDFVPWLKKRLPDWEKGAPPTKISQAPIASQYDAALAARLGADERGMKMFVVCILKTGPKDAEIKGDERKALFNGHFVNITRLADEGKLAVAGPFEDNGRAYRGLYIFNVPTIEEAEKLVVLDPAVKAGIFVPELTLWYGSAAMMTINDVHKRITKPQPKTN
jgi:uncharacterized protein YciI